jgi:hypothetical protein
MRGIVAALALVVSAGACDRGLTGVNENPDQSTSAPPGNILAGAIRDMAANNGQYGAFGYWSQFYNTELWVQHVAQSQYNDEDQYRPREGVNQFIWAGLYGSLLDLKATRSMAAESGDDNLWAVSEIMSVYGFQVLTDMFGDVPYTEALRLDEGIQNPKYDAQSAIYTDLLARLEAATARIDPSADVTFAAGDLIYGGDMAKWEKFANSLRLRIAMRMSNTELSDQARAAFQAAWSGPRFESNSDNAALEWTTANVGPENEMIVKAGRKDDFRISATLVDAMKALHDPRLAIYADPAASDGVIRGLPNGSLPASLGLTVSDFSTIGSAFVAADAPSVFMSYSEVLFLGAEAAERGWIAGDAADLYRAGIAASLRQYGIAESAIDAYLAQPSVAYDGLESIGLQKWISLYLAGPEAFADYRRTGLPHLEPSNGALQDMIPTRLPYPSNEVLYNPTNFDPYKSVYIDDPVWWAKQ